MEDYKKKYEDALERARKVYLTNSVENKRSSKYIFHELKETENGNIRREIIDYLKGFIPHHDDGLVAKSKVWIAWLEKQYDITKLSEEEQNKFAKGVLISCATSFINYLDAHKYEGKMCVSNGECEDIENAFHNAMWDRLHRYYCKYIEKQGEQKPTDKVEPDFEIRKGAWYVCDTSRYTDFIVGEVYFCPKNGMLKPNENGMARYVAKHCFHLWTINDAKYGDILACDKNVVIVDHIGDFEGESTIYSWYFADSKKFYGMDTKDPDMWSIEGFHPATKEQRGLLFSKMKEAGYEWDSENKELKKIEQKPTWSEEDEERIEFLIAMCNDEQAECVNNSTMYRECTETKDWLKSIKSHTKHVEWTEQDDDMLLEISSNLLYAAKNRPTCNMEIYKEELDWLKRICKK